MKGVVAGVDVGGTKVSATAFNRDGESIGNVRLVTDASGPTGAYRSTEASIRKLAAAVGVSSFEAIGVGIPGLVDHASGVVSHAVNLGIGDDPLPMGPLLEAAFGTAVHIENDVNAAALGSFVMLRVGDRVDDLAYLSIGTGVAAGLVLNGRLHRGRHGVAGEIGHLRVTSAGPTCECGLTGCLESVVSGGAIERAWPVEAGLSPAVELFGAAANGEASAISLVTLVADHLAHAVHLLALAYDVDRIVIGGGVAQAGEPLHEAIKQGLDRLGDQSAFVQALELGNRVRRSYDGPVASIGAAAIIAPWLWSLESDPVDGPQ